VIIEKENGLATVFGDLNEKADIIFKNQYLLAEYSSIPRDYGNGYLMTEIEAHTLGFIQDQEGITATELARNTHRTKGGISKLISKLESKGFVERVNEVNNRRTYRLYLTEDGKRACETHRDYDRTHMLIMINNMLQDCTEEEIRAFFKVMTTRNRIIEKQFEDGQL
jgi:DNA-binding MarR family transcriptional regulator